MPIKIGFELELQLVNSQGVLVNRAEEILKHPLNEGFIIRELQQTIVEITAPPGRTIQEAHQLFRRQLLIALKIATDLGLRLVPLSTTFDPKAIVKSNDNKRARSSFKRRLFGDTMHDLEHHIAGAHVHFDRLTTPALQALQYQLMVALDPLFALMSSSPFFLGQSSLKDYRVDIYRNRVYGDFPLQGSLRGYPTTIAGAIQFQQESYDDMVAKAHAAGLQPVGITPLDAYWGPLRVSKKTIETRASDTNTFSMLTSYAYAYHTLLSYIASSPIQFRIDNSDVVPVENLFLLKNKTLTLPSINRLIHFQERGIVSGLADDVVFEYITNILTLVQSLANPSDIHFLKPLIDTLESRKSLSDDLIDIAQRFKYKDAEGKLTTKGANALCVNTADLFERDVKNESFVLCGSEVMGSRERL